MTAIRETPTPSLLDITRTTAVARLGRYLRTPAERALHAEPGREHQGDVMDDTLKFLGSGKTAGYIELPTGTGKTVIAASLIRALRMNTIVVSPTGTILDQTKRTIEDINPDINVSNFDGRSKSIASNIINTTINSLSNLAEIGPLAEATELIILDEIHHGTLGEKRHKLWRKFPNALIVGLTATPDPSKLEGLQDRGLVDSEERWTGAFTELISSMSREEAMQRGALTPVDIHMIRKYYRGRCQSYQ